MIMWHGDPRRDDEDPLAGFRGAVIGSATVSVFWVLLVLVLFTYCA